MKVKIATGELYAIDKSMPIELKCNDRRRFPFFNMEIGDSFLIPKKEQSPEKARSSIGTAVVTFNKRYKKKIKVTSRVVEDGLRVWRIK